MIESNKARRDLLDVIDVPDLTEDERQAIMKKPARKPRKDKGTKRKRPLRDKAKDRKDRKDKGTKRKRPLLTDIASKLIERIEAVENVSADDFVYDLPTSRCEVEGFSRTRWSEPGNDVQSIGWDLS